MAWQGMGRQASKQSKRGLVLLRLRRLVSRRVFSVARSERKEQSRLYFLFFPSSSITLFPVGLTSAPHAAGLRSAERGWWQVAARLGIPAVAISHARSGFCLGARRGFAGVREDQQL
jgi:hypothetical protein